MPGVIATVPKYQFSDATGTPLAGGTLTTYIAGTNTLTNTWQDQALSIANTNPIVLDSRGECVLWLSSSVNYKFVLKNSAGVTQWTVDNINSLNADSLAFLASGTGAVTRTVQSKLRDVVSVKDFGAAGDGVTNDTAAFTAAIAAAEAINSFGDGNGGGRPTILVPDGLYVVNALTINKRLRLLGSGSSATALKLATGQTASLLTINAENLAGTSIDDASHSLIEGMTLIGNRVDSVTTGVSHGINCPAPAWPMATQYSPSIRASDVVIFNFTGNGIFLGDNRNWCLADRVIVRYCNDNALATYSYDSRFTACDFGVCKNYGVREYAGGANVFTGCNLYNNTINYVANSTSNSSSMFVGCSIDYATQQGVSISQATGAKKFIGCRFYGNSQTVTNTYSDILVTGPGATVSVVACSFTKATTQSKYLLELAGTVTAVFQANDYIKTGASAPFGTAVSNIPAELVSSDDLYYNVMSWGATGDGATDDSAAINAALAAASSSGRTVYFPNAVYLCSSQIVIDQCRVIADNAQLTFSGLSGTTDCVVLRRSSPLAPLVIDGLKINANSTGRDAVVVQSGSSGCDFMVLRQMAIQGAVRDALAFEPSSANNWIQNFRVQDLRVYSPGRHGIRMVVPALSNTFINQGTFENVDIRGAGQTTASSYDVFCDCQGSTSSQKISEINFTSCDFDAAGAANHAQGSILMGLSGSAGGYGGWTFVSFTPEDTGSVITGFPNIIQVSGTPTINGLVRIGGITTKYNLLIDPTKASRIFNWDGTGNRQQIVYDMGSPGFSASYANDAAAAAVVPVGGLYRNGSVVQVRVV